MGFFGSSRKPAPRPARRLARGAVRRQAPARVDAARIDAAIQACVNEAGVDGGPFADEVALIADLCLDQVDAVELLLDLEERLGVRDATAALIANDADIARVTIGDVRRALRRAAGCSPEQPAQVVGAPRRADLPRAHRLWCASCAAPTIGRATRPGWTSCATCGAERRDLGPLPMPMLDVPMGSAVSELGVVAPAPAELAEVVTWACQWCGGAMAPQRGDCSRCGAPLRALPPAHLASSTAIADAAGRAALQQQAIHPMTGAVALLRLGRLSPDAARAIGADEELVARMRPQRRPW